MEISSPSETFQLQPMYGVLDIAYMGHMHAPTDLGIGGPMSCECIPDGGNRSAYNNDKELDAENNRMANAEIEMTTLIFILLLLLMTDDD